MDSDKIIITRLAKGNPLILLVCNCKYKMTVVKLHLLIFLVYLQVKLNFGARIFYDKCDYKGFTCVKSKTVPGKYDITYECSNIKVGRPIYYLYREIFLYCTLIKNN